jgi:uncharacterized protein (DUF433 family)
MRRSAPTLPSGKRTPMPESSYRLQRHQGETTLRLYQIPLRWLIVERLAAPLIEHSLTWRLGNWFFAEADARYTLVHSIPIDDDDEEAIDAEWHRIWAEDDEEPDLSLIPAELIVRDPEICSGRPTMRGTRILASRIAGELAAGTTWEQLHEWYPSIPTPNTAEETADER